MAKEDVRRFLEKNIDLSGVNQVQLTDAGISTESTIVDLLNLDSEDGGPSMVALVKILEMLENIDQVSPTQIAQFVETYKRELSDSSARLTEINIQERINKLSQEEADALRLKYTARRLLLNTYIIQLSAVAIQAEPSSSTKEVKSEILASEQKKPEVPDGIDTGNTASSPVEPSSESPTETKQKKVRARKTKPPELSPQVTQGTPLDDLLTKIGTDDFDEKSDDEKEKMLVEALQLLVRERLRINLKAMGGARLTEEMERRRSSLDGVESYLDAEAKRLRDNRNIGVGTTSETSSVDGVDQLVAIVSDWNHRAELASASPNKDDPAVKAEVQALLSEVAQLRKRISTTLDAPETTAELKIRLNESSEAFENVVTSLTPEPEIIADEQIDQSNIDKSTESSLQKLAYICEGADFQVQPFRHELVHTEAEFEAERMRLMHDLYVKIMKMAKGTLVDACSADYMLTKPFALFSDVFYATADPQSKQYSLLNIFVALPSTIRIDLGNGMVEKPLLQELKEYLDKLNTMTKSLFSGSAELRQYSSESDFIDKVAHRDYQQPSISKASIIDLLNYKAVGTWLHEDEDIYPTLRKVLTKLFVFEKQPDIPENSTENKNVKKAKNKLNKIKRGSAEYAAAETEYNEAKRAYSAKVDDYNKVLTRFNAEVERHNPFPVEHLPEQNVELKIKDKKKDKDEDGNSWWIGIADPSVTYDWVKQEAVAAPLSATQEMVYDMAFRVAFAYLRATGEEERFDRRVKRIDANNPRSGSSSYAFRKASVLFNLDGYTRFSMESKGSARDPVSSQIATLHPALTLPLDWFVMVPVTKVDHPIIPLANVIRDDKWDEYDSTPEKQKVMTNTPAGSWSSQMQQAKHQLGFWNMSGSTTSLFPKKLDEMVKVEAGGKVGADLRLASMLKEVSGGGKQLSHKSAREILSRLYLTTEAMYDPRIMEEVHSKILLRLTLDAQGDFPTANIFKNAAEYYIAKTPPSREIIEELFASSDGSHDTYVIKEGFDKGDTELETMYLFGLLLRAELERYAYTEKSMGVASRLMDSKSSKKLDLGQDMQTKGNQQPLDFVQRRALEYYLAGLYAQLPEQFKKYGLTLLDIRELFVIVGIEGNAASEYYDLQKLLLTDKNALRQAVGEAPIFGKNIFSRLLHNIGKILNADQGVT